MDILWNGETKLCNFLKSSFVWMLDSKSLVTQIVLLNLFCCKAEVPCKVINSEESVCSQRDGVLFKENKAYCWFHFPWTALLLLKMQV